MNSQLSPVPFRSACRRGLILLFLWLSACASPPLATPTVQATPISPEVELIIQSEQEVVAGQPVAILMNLKPHVAVAEAEWTLIEGKGELEVKANEAVLFTPSEAAEVMLIQVRGTTMDGAPFQQTIPIRVVAAQEPVTAATGTEVPVVSAGETEGSTTASPVEPPKECNHPVVTRNLFPQLAAVNGQFPMYADEEPEETFLCEAVYEPVLKGSSMSVHIRYDNQGSNVGWWGIATPNGYDASSFRQICFSVFTRLPDQSFRLKLKDTTKLDDGVIIITETVDDWQNICTDMSRFSELGINLKSLDNVNLGFEQGTKSAEIWVAGFLFKE